MDGVLLVRSVEDDSFPLDAVAEVAGAVGGDEDVVTVIVGTAAGGPAPDAEHWARLGALLDSLRERGTDRIRLVMSGAGADRPDRPGVARRIADAWEIEVTAPDGAVLITPGGVLFVHGDSAAGCGWWRFAPGVRPRRLGRRAPVPAWEEALDGVPVRTSGGCVVDRVPAGVVIRPADAPGPAPDDLSFSVPVDFERLTVLVGAPQAEDVAADEVAAVLAGLPAAERARARLAPGGRRDLLRLGQSVAELLGTEVEVLTGLPLLDGHAAPGTSPRPTLVGRDGRPSWRPFVSSVLCAPTAADGRTPAPTPVRLHLPEWILGGTEPGTVRLTDRWQATVTRAGLALWAPGGPRPAPAGGAVDPDTCAVELGAPGQPLDDSLLPALALLLRGLGTDLRSRTTLMVRGRLLAGDGPLRRLAAEHGVPGIRYVTSARSGPAGPTRATGPTAVLRPDAERPGTPDGPARGAVWGAEAPRSGGASADSAVSGAAASGAATVGAVTTGAATTGLATVGPATVGAPTAEPGGGTSGPDGEAGAEANSASTSGTSKPGSSAALRRPDTTSGDPTPPAVRGPGGDGIASAEPVRPDGRTEGSAAVEGRSAVGRAGAAGKPPRAPRRGESAEEKGTEGTARITGPQAADPAAPPGGGKPAVSSEPLMEGSPAEAVEGASGTPNTGLPAPTPPAPQRTAAPVPAPENARGPASEPPAPQPAPQHPRTGEAPARTPAAALPFVPGHVSSAAERAAFRDASAGAWEGHAAAVSRVLTRLPALRGHELEVARTDLVAAHAYLTAEEGPLHHRELIRDLRTGEGRLMPYAGCLASALRRLPSYRGVALRGGVADGADPATGSLLQDPAPVSALAGTPALPTGTPVRYAIWSVTGRTVRQLHAHGSPGTYEEIVFVPGTGFRVLGVRAVPGAPSVVLLRELPGNATAYMDGSEELSGLDLKALAHLEQALAKGLRAGEAAEWPERCSGPLGQDGQSARTAPDHPSPHSPHAQGE
ncbi:hypothetical protein [Streptomyces sp. NPDC003832]